MRSHQPDDVDTPPDVDTAADAGPAAGRPARLRVGVVGAGRVGSVLGAALDRVGHRVVAASAVSLASRNRARALLPQAQIRSAAEVLDGVDLALLAVPESALPDLVAGLARTGAVAPGQLIAHTAGRYGTDVLDPATRAGALPLALHPALAFTGGPADLSRLADATFAVTAPDPLWPAAAALVVEMGGDPVRVEDRDRTLYHAALSHGAEHVVAVLNDAAEMLRRAGVDHPERVLAPLLSAATDHALRADDGALRGPAVDGDADGVAAQLTAIEQVLPDAVPTYRALARRAADRAMGSGALDPHQAESLLDVLRHRDRA